jgi:hypothetical protein
VTWRKWFSFADGHDIPGWFDRTAPWTVVARQLGLTWTNPAGRAIS